MDIDATGGSLPLAVNDPTKSVPVTAYPDRAVVTVPQQREYALSKRQGYLIIALLFLGLAFGLWNTLLKPQPHWEYRVERYTAEGNSRTGADALKSASVQIGGNVLTTIGAQGWELVGTYLEVETAYPNFGDTQYVTGLQPNMRPQDLVLIFKREIN